jgi:hypothetical protein
MTLVHLCIASMHLGSLKKKKGEDDHHVDQLHNEWFVLGVGVISMATTLGRRERARYHTTGPECVITTWNAS